jgi:D-sedoheptulose 7-phosphate isomerase
MGDDRIARVDTIFADTIALHERVRGQHAVLVAAADAIAGTLARGGKVLVFGNGGSAADAQHLAAELVGRFARERRAAAAIALSTDTSILTAVANDYGFERIFARQIEALANAGDVAVGISTSGRSPNVLAALSSARRRGLTTVGLTGSDGGAMATAVDIHVNTPHGDAARVQEVHRTQIHVICALVEETL